MKLTATLAWMALTAMIATGCGSDPKPPPDTAGNNAVAPPPAPTTAASGEDDESSNVRIDKRIMDMCNLPEPHFGFDSSAVSEGARATLDALATCFIDGKGKGKNLRIVGHADPRGETEYNFALGQRRAGAVGTYLGKKGLGEERVETSSRGELEATGSDEEGWAKDRRVEILLAE